MQKTRRCLPIAAAGWMLAGAAMGCRAYAMPPGATEAGCESAGLAAERASGLPPGILLAIGRVESGRWDAASGRLAAWPWSINVAGEGHWFDNEAAAAVAVRTALANGTRSIDVGCFQVNLLWHPTAFSSLEQAFDPDANAAYAAGFLLRLFGRTGSWEAAIENYHSADPVLGFAYRQQVLANWTPVAVDPVATRAGPTLARAPRHALSPVIYAGVAVWTPVGSDGGDVVVMPGAPPPPAPLPAPVLPAVSYRMPRGLIPHR